MNVDPTLMQLPLTKTKPESLFALFGSSNIVPFWVADMEFAIAEPIQKALEQRIANASFGYEYKPDSFFAAQKNWYQQQNGITLDQTKVLYSPSITTTLSIVLEAHTEENDGIIIQPPVFMEFREVIRNAKRKIVKNPLQLVGNQYQMDFADLEAKAKEESNKVLIICNPHNPVGRVWTKAELQQVVRICKENNVLLISDEIHKDIVLFEHKFTSVLTLEKEYNRVVVCTSEAKTFNLCGISDSMAIVGNDALREAIVPIFKKYNLGRTNALTRVAVEAGYKFGADWLQQVRQIIEKNCLAIEKELEDSKINLIRPQGTYQVWLDFNAIFTDSKTLFEEVTEKSGIGLNAGHWFGKEGACFMRMNIACSTEKVIDAIQKIKQAVAS